VFILALSKSRRGAGECRRYLHRPLVIGHGQHEGQRGPMKSFNTSARDILPGMEESNLHAEDAGLEVLMEQNRPTDYSSAPALARAFDGAILEPSWWPADVRDISYSLYAAAHRTHYRIGSRRADGAPIYIIGFREAAWAGRSPREWLKGEWSEPSNLAQVRGLVGRVGTPPNLHVVIYHRDLAVQLIGYRTEDEITSAVKSLAEVAPA
jgi:hypothetical protein